MLRSDWQKELVSVQEQIEQLQCNEKDTHLLDQSILSLIRDPLLVISPDLLVMDAMVRLLEKDLEFALVQESSDTILGVLRREIVDEILVRGPSAPDTLAVRSIMDRNICIEPDSASVLEVLERMALGGCPCTVIVDSHGHPKGIVSPIVLFQSLRTVAPMPKELVKSRYERVA